MTTFTLQWSELGGEWKDCGEHYCYLYADQATHDAELLAKAATQVAKHEVSYRIKPVRWVREDGTKTEYPEYVAEEGA